MRTGSTPTARPVFIVSTQGLRNDSLYNLVSSIKSWSSESVVSIANQGLGRIELFDDGVWTDVRCIRSRGGISQGRNDAIRQLWTNDAQRVYFFPNDNTLYSALMLDRLFAAAASMEPSASGRIISGRLEYPDGSAPFRTPSKVRPLGPGEVFYCMSATIAIACRKSEYGQIYFDAGIGTGSPSRYQAGEETDLLLRLMNRRNFHLIFDPDVVIGGKDTTSTLKKSLRHRKLNGYGQSMTYVMERHGFRKRTLVKAILRPCVRGLWALLRGDFAGASDAYWTARGRLAGICVNRAVTISRDPSRSEAAPTRTAEM